MKIKYNEGSKVDKVNLAELERQAQLDENSFEDNPSINADINNKNIKTLLQDAENRIEKEQERKDANTDRQMREAAEKHFRRDLNEGGSMLMPPEREEYFDGGRAFKKLFKGAASVAEPAAKAAKSGVKGLGNIIQDTATVAKKGAKGLGHVIQDTATVAKRGAKGLGKMGGNLGFTQDQPDIAFAEGGSMLMPPEMGIEKQEQEEEQEMPVDTYPNIPPDEMAAAEASQLPDEQMEDKHLEYVLDKALDPEDQEYLMGVLETNERLSNIFDKVMDVAAEFSGEGEVDGPGTGVSDSIPARLSDGEFVFTKKATDQIGSDQLQTMMDDAERAYDGGYMKKAFGGLTLDPMDNEKSYGVEQMNETQNELRKQMLGANRMPSVLQ